MKVESLKNRIRYLAGVEEESSIYEAELDEISGYAADMEAYYNVRFDDKTTILMVLIGNFGMHIFIKTEKTSNFDEIKPLINKMVYKYHLDHKTVFWGLNEGLNEVLTISNDGEFIKTEDLVSDFINYDRNIRRPYAEILRLNLTSLNNLLMPEKDVEKLKEEYKDESIDFEKETYVKEIFSDEMVEFYKSKIEKNDNKNKKIRVDEEGNEYIKHETKMKFLGITTGEGYYKLSDEDSEKTFIITLFGGIFGLHHLLRGDFLRAFFYLITGGGFSVFYISDVISICLGTYYYDEVKYDFSENGKHIRKKERVYLRPVEDIRKKFIGIIAAILIGISFTFFVIKPGYTKLNKGISDASKEVANEYLDNKYNEIMDLYSGD